MKHNLLITITLLVFFILAQVAGLWLINIDAAVLKDDAGNIVVAHEDTSLGPRPETKGAGSFLYLIIGVAIGTVLVFPCCMDGNVHINRSYSKNRMVFCI